MDKTFKIKPGIKFYEDQGILHIKVEKIVYDSKSQLIKVFCSGNKIAAFSDITILKENLKQKLGENIEIEINENIKIDKINEKDAKELFSYLIDSFKEKSQLIKVYLAIQKYDIDLEKKSVKIFVSNKTAFNKFSKSKILNQLIEKFNEISSETFTIKVEIGDFNSEIKELDQKFDKYLEKVSTNITQGNTKLLGDKISKKLTPISNFGTFQPGEKICIQGEAFDVEYKALRGDKKLLIFKISDRNDSVYIKCFLDKKIKINEKDCIKVEGRIESDRYRGGEETIMAEKLEKIQPLFLEREDKYEGEKRVELHMHTKMSSLDSVVEIKELIDRVHKWRHKGIAITDHGVIHGFPTAYNYAKKYEDFKVVFGMEAYLVDDEKTMIWRAKNKYIENEEYTVFDIETTGFNPVSEEIIEIGAVKIKNKKIIDEYSKFVFPNKKIPEKITKLTGITNEMVENADKIEVVLEDFLNFVGKSTMVAHNANFDMSFIIEKARKHLDKTINNCVIDTLSWSRNINSKQSRHNLNALCKFYNITLKNHHRATDDAKATSDIFLKLIDQVVQKDIHKLNEVDSYFETDIKKIRPNHAIILVKNREGLRNLYELVSKSHIDYFFKTPRIPKSVLKKMRKGLLIGSACLQGEVVKAYQAGKRDDDLLKVAKFYDYLEIQPISNNKILLEDSFSSEKDLEDMNKAIYEAGQKAKLLVVATNDAHYLDPDDKIFRDILLYGKGFKKFDLDYGIYLKNTQEMLDEFKYLGEEIAEEVVIKNSNLIFEKIEKIKPIPDGFYPPKIEGEEKEVLDITYKRAKEIYGDPLPKIIEERLKKELDAIVKNGFSVLYLSAQKLVKKSLDMGYIVGSRGSVGSSLVAYMMNITEVNAMYPHYICPECKHSEFTDLEGSGVDLPDKNCPNCEQKLEKQGHSIPFEVFMGFKGEKVPDIDLNFSGDVQEKIHRYTEELFGESNVFKAGTISTLAKQNALGYVRKYTEENQIYKNRSELERLANGCINVRKTTGQHPGGMIVLPEDRSIYEFTPIQKPANDMKSKSITTHFDYHVMDEQLIKLDILGHDDPTTLKVLCSELKRVEGIELKPQDIPLNDKETLSLFSSTKALDVKVKEIDSEIGTFGIPEFGTRFVRDMLVDTKPTKFSELVRISGLSHGTDVWLGNAQNYIREKVAQLSEVISVRDDIMNMLIDSGIDPSKSFEIMEFVRKGKPNKDPGKWKEYAQLMKKHNVKDWYIKSCEKIKYMFPKGHAVAYVMMAVRIAYFKVHHPIIFYAAFLSRKAHDFDFTTMYIDVEKIKNEQRKLNIDIKNKNKKLDVNNKSKLILFEILIEMHYRNIGFLPVDIYKSKGFEFVIEDKKIRIPLIAIAGLGETVAHKIVEERQKSKFISKQDLMRRSKMSSTVLKIFENANILQDMQKFNQKQLF